jgi:uncharacterized SAM-binding protein YcdF (DUF218 family)
MGFWIITIILGAILAFSLWRDKRRFINAVLFLLFLCSLLMSLEVSSQKMILIGLFGVLLIPLSILVITIFFLAAGAIAIKREGLRLSSAISILFVVAMWGGFIFVVASMINTSFLPASVALVLCSFIVMAECYIAFTFTALFFYSLLYRIMPKRKDCDFIIVHGAGLIGGLTVTPLLANRLDKAIEVYERGERKARFIVSGGQGADEKVSEAHAMREYLLQQGIPDEKIIMEDKSTTTYENMRNSKVIIDELSANEGIEKAYCIFVTNAYHVFRTSTYARKVGLNAEGVGCKTAAYYLPNAFIREYVAVMVKHKVAPIILLAIWAAGVFLSMKGL